jgi:hypothetical protein
MHATEDLFSGVEHVVVKLLSNVEIPTVPTLWDLSQVCRHRGQEEARGEHCTSKLQVCDVSVNASLSSAIRGQYALFTMQHPDAPIERSRIAHWISHAKGKITPDTIVNGFKKIGIYYPLPTVIECNDACKAL